MSASSASKWTPILKGTAKVQAVAWAVAVPAGAAFQMVPQIREMRGLTCTTRGLELQTNVPEDYAKFYNHREYSSHKGWVGYLA